MEGIKQIMAIGVNITVCHMLFALVAMVFWIIMAIGFGDGDKKKSWFWGLKTAEIYILLFVVEGLRASYAEIVTGGSLMAETPLFFTFGCWFASWMLLIGGVCFTAGFLFLTYLTGRAVLQKGMVKRITTAALKPFKLYVQWNGNVASVIADWGLKDFLKEPITSYRAYKIMLADEGRISKETAVEIYRKSCDKQ